MPEVVGSTPTDVRDPFSTILIFSKFSSTVYSLMPSCAAHYTSAVLCQYWKECASTVVDEVLVVGHSHSAGVQKQGTGRDLLTMVAQSLDLYEMDFFGLVFYDTKDIWACASPFTPIHLCIHLYTMLHYSTVQ